MIALLAASILLSQATAMPSVSPSASTPWKTAPRSDQHYYAHYVRQEADGTQSLILGRLDICDCQPVNDADMIQNGAEKLPGAHVVRSTITVCGAQAERIITTGVATSQTNNSEILLFRQDKAMVILIYAFKLQAPLAEDEAMLLTVCPKQP
jgi:hypothetical protein